MKRLLQLMFYEVRKLLYRKFIFVLAILILLTAPVFSLLYKYVIADDAYRTEEKTEISQSISNYKSLANDSLTQMNQMLSTGTTGDAMATCVNNLLNYETEANYYQLLSEKGLDDNEYYYMNKVAEKLAELQAKALLCSNEKYRVIAAQSGFDEERIKADYADYQEIWDSADYSRYIQKYKNELREEYEGEREQLDIEQDVIVYRLAADLKGENTGAELENLLDQIRTLERQEITGYDETSSDYPVVLSEEDLSRVSDELRIIQYRLSEGEVNLSDLESMSEDNMPFLEQCIGFLVLLMLVYLSASFAGEMTSRRIGLTLSRPFKRSQIYIVKLLTLLLLGVVVITLSYFWSILWTKLLYGKIGYSAFFYTRGNGVRHIPAIWNGLLIFLIDFFWIFLAGALALTLTVSVRNVVVAAVVPVAAYYGGMFSADLLKSVPYDWVRFLPPYHFHLAQTVFSGQNASSTGFVSLPFTIIYLVILAFCIMYIGFDSFTRRDF